MLYRAAIALVVLFWGAMWTLLIRSELRPQEAGWRAVPVELVLKQLFHHGQSSDLNIRSGASRLGQLRLSPRTNQETGAHALEVIGNVQVDGPGVPPQRAFWNGAFEMDRAFRVTASRVNVTIRARGPQTPEMVATTLELVLDPLAGKARYRLGLAGEAPVEQEFTLDEAGLNAVLARWGVGSEWTRHLSAGRGAIAPVLTARQARLHAHGEELETFLVTIKNQGQTLLEMHVSQLGQILKAKTLVGWELSTD